MLVIEKQSESIEGGTVEWESTEAPVCRWYHLTAPLDSLQLLWCWGMVGFLSSLLNRSPTSSALEELGWGLQKQAGKEYRKQGVLGMPRGCLGRDGSLAKLQERDVKEYERVFTLIYSLQAQFLPLRGVLRWYSVRIWVRKQWILKPVCR